MNGLVFGDELPKLVEFCGVNVDKVSVMSNLNLVIRKYFSRGEKVLRL